MAVARISLKNEMISEIQEEDTVLIETVEKKVLELCRSNLKGITERHIREDQPDLTPTIRMKVINSLLASGKLELCKQGSTLVYRFVCLFVCLFICLFICLSASRLKEVISLNSELTSELSSLNAEQLLVYRTLESVKGNGLISLEIRNRTSLPQVQVTHLPIQTCPYMVVSTFLRNMSVIDGCYKVAVIDRFDCI